MSSIPCRVISIWSSQPSVIWYYFSSLRPMSKPTAGPAETIRKREHCSAFLPCPCPLVTRWDPQQPYFWYTNSQDVPTAVMCRPAPDLLQGKDLSHVFVCVCVCARTCCICPWSYRSVQVQTACNSLTYRTSLVILFWVWVLNKQIVCFMVIIDFLMPVSIDGNCRVKA